MTANKDLIARLEGGETGRLQGRIADAPSPSSWWPYIAAQVVILVFALAPAAALIAALLRAEGE